MTLKDFREYTKDLPDNIAERIILSIGIRDEKDIIDNNDGTISFQEFSERYLVNNISMIMEGTLPPKIFFVTNKKNNK